MTMPALPNGSDNSSGGNEVRITRTLLVGAMVISMASAATMSTAGAQQHAKGLVWNETGEVGSKGLVWNETGEVGSRGLVWNETGEVGSRG
jgi:hypothetical protein